MFDCPQEPFANVRWRQRCRDRALVDKGFRDAFWQACLDDPLFFFNAVLWVYEPRAKVKVKPFCLWPHQAPVILKMDATLDEAMEREHPISLTVPKSRAQGATYIYLGVFIRRALKDAGFAAGLVTRNEELVDSRTDADAVMYKLAWMLDRVPKWMLPDGYQRNSTEHTIALPNGSVFSGYAATGDVARGGRKTAFAFDEPGSEEFVQGNKDYKIMSSVGSVSNCVAEGTLVVTDRGPVAIENVSCSDRVWDGKTWVSHDGCVYKGQKETIRSYRVGLTPDHRVLTTRGWTHAIEGFDRAEIRLPDGYRARHFATERQREARRQCEVEMPVRLRHADDSERVFAHVRPTGQLWMQEERENQEGKYEAQWHRHGDLQGVGVDDSAMHEPVQSELFAVRWARHYGMRAMDALRPLPEGYGLETEGAFAGTCQQRWRLLPGELPLGNHQGAGEQHESQSLDRNIARDAEDRGDCCNCRSQLRCNRKPHQEGLDRGLAAGSIPVCDHLEAVYDLLNCGPRRAFTVLDDDGRPLLVHNCTFLVSTYGVDSGVFYESATDPDNHRIVKLDWKDNPVHAKHAYIIKDGEAMAVRPAESMAVKEYIKTHGRELKSIERRGHKMDGKVRSPWYDAHCLLPGGTPRFIARELDMDARGAVGKLFDANLLDTVKQRDGRAPIWQGKPVFDAETLKLSGLLARSDGPLKLWFKPGVDNSPPLGPFSVGCDIAMGSDGAYSSNSVASIIDDRTGEQVGEYTIMGMQSIVFARNVIGLCRWLRNAKLGWEDSGVSGPFAKEVMETVCYGNVYFREVAEIGSRKKTRKAGWRNSKDEDKADLFEKMALAMESKRFIVRSEDLIRECGEYEWEKGKIIHRPTKNLDQSAKAHGDRAIAAGVAYLVYSEDLRTDRIDTDEETGQTPEYGSYLWREQQERSRVNAESPEYSIRDLMLT